jgi:hypothetical protein
MSKLTPKPESIAQLVFLVRGEKVLLSQSLAELYGVSVSALNQAVKRNHGRFPDDFMFQLTADEFENLKSRIVTSSWGGLRRALPYAFTEQGIAMLSSVLRSPRAVEVNIAIMRTFVQLRRLMDSNRHLARKIEAMEKKYDEQFIDLRCDQAAHRRRQRPKGPVEALHRLQSVKHDMANRKSTAKTVETLTHDEAKRKNIPTAEFQSVLNAEEQKPAEIRGRARFAADAAPPNGPPQAR